MPGRRVAQPNTERKMKPHKHVELIKAWAEIEVEE
jgi:hypothetical protein